MKRRIIEAISARAGIPVAADDDVRYEESPTVGMRTGGSLTSPAPSSPDPNREQSVASEGAAEQVDTENCPFCGADVCTHHAVSLDLTFREVVGGELFEACGSYLARRKAELAIDDEDANVSDQAFDDLEALVGGHPDVVALISEWEGGPGQSSLMRHCWIAQPQSMAALARSLSDDGSP